VCLRTAFNPSYALFPLIYLFGAWAINYLFGFISFEYPRQSALARDAGAALVLPLWFCLINFIMALMVVFQLLKIYTTKYLRVRLFEIEELSPLCNVVMVNLLLSFLIISTYAINGLFIDIPNTDKYLVLMGCLVLAFFLLSPMFLIRKVIRKRKEMMLERINQSLNEQMLANTDENSYRRLVDDETRLQFISDLLIVRKEINQAPLWPMRLPFTIKIVLILMLPILSWLGAGLVSQLLKVWQT
jgi:hypothetical protein